MDRKRLLNVHMRSRFQAEPSYIVMTFGRSGNVDDIWLGPIQKFTYVGKATLDREPLRKLSGHERFAIGCTYDFAALDRLNCRRMSVGNFPAPDDGDLKHWFHHARHSGN